MVARYRSVMSTHSGPSCRLAPPHSGQGQRSPGISALKRSPHATHTFIVWPAKSTSSAVVVVAVVVVCDIFGVLSRVMWMDGEIGGESGRPCRTLPRDGELDGDRDVVLPALVVAVARRTERQIILAEQIRV